MLQVINPKLRSSIISTILNYLFVLMFYALLSERKYSVDLHEVAGPDWLLQICLRSMQALPSIQTIRQDPRILHEKLQTRKNKTFELIVIVSLAYSCFYVLGVLRPVSSDFCRLLGTGQSDQK